jgi:hypothetical protein
MHMNFLTSRLALLAIAVFLFPAVTQACNTAPFVETWENNGSFVWLDGPGDCSLDVSVTEPSPSAAIVHFRRASPTQSLRLSFVVDPHLASLVSSTSTATLASGVASKVPVAGPAEARLFRIMLIGNPGGANPKIGIEAACNQAGVPLGTCLNIAPVSIADFPLRITLEVHMGAGSAGQVQLWLGDDVSGTPTLSLDDLDNERWQGIDRVSLGLSDVSESFFNVVGTQPLSFSEISVSDPELFWNGFENDVVGSVTTNATAIGTSVPLGLAGNTCGGSIELPEIAFGSTRLWGPAAIHSWTVPGGNQRWVQLSSSLPSMSMFACSLGSGPSGPCVKAESSSGVIAISVPGTYQLVVASLQQECGAYSLSVSGTLGRAQEDGE